MTNNKFKFWCPIEKAQSVDPNTGETVMKLGGIASTSDEDSDGEFLDPKGFDINPLMKSGLVNWHHQAKGQPATIIGEPSKVEIRPEGLYIETDLYPSSKMASEVWQLAETLEKDSKTRRLGYSIEGKVIKRESNDKNSPLYKNIIKAMITGVAITHQPKNAQTFANIIKGEIDNDFDEKDEEVVEETNETKSSNIKTFTKSEVVEKLFQDVTVISIEKAEKIYKMIKKLANMKGKNVITDEDISKAYEALGLNVSLEDIEKGENFDDEDAEAEKNGFLKYDKPKSKAKSKTKSEDEVEDEDEKEVEKSDEDEVEEDEVEEKEVEKGNRFDRLEKAIASSHQINAKYIKALGVMVKDTNQKLEIAADREVELMDIIKSQEGSILDMAERIEEFGSSSPAPKSLSNSRPVERTFAKANDGDFGENNQPNTKTNQVSISKNKEAVSELLDQATFAKGYDEEFSKAMTHFDATKQLPLNIIARIKNEFGFEIIK